MFDFSFLKKFNKNMTFEIDRNMLFVGIAIIAIVATGVLIFTNKNLNQFSFFKSGFGLSNDAIAKKSLDYLNTTVLAGQSQATLVSVSEESGLVKMKIKIGTSEYDSYVTKDGRFLFPQAFDMLNAKISNAQSQNTNSQPAAPDHSNDSNGAGSSGSKAPSCGV